MKKAVVVAVVVVIVLLAVPSVLNSFRARSAAASPLSEMIGEIKQHYATVMAWPPIPAEVQGVIEGLASKSGSIEPMSDMMMAHTMGDTQTLSAAEEKIFTAQWHAALDAAPTFDTPAKAAAAGYILSSFEVTGVGTHWIDWSLVSKPFDPARPSMLLFSGKGDSAQLVGFSYYLKSTTEPEGFAGPNDHWHQHAGLCYANGWLIMENVPSPEYCPAQWLQGDNLWMLHAWVVASHANPRGIFESVNPTVCAPGKVCILE